MEGMSHPAGASLPISGTACNINLDTHQPQPFYSEEILFFLLFYLKYALFLAFCLVIHSVKSLSGQGGILIITTTTSQN